MKQNNPVKYSSDKLKKFKTVLDESLESTTDELNSLKAIHINQKQRIANSNVDFNENSKHFQQQAKNKRTIRRLQNKARELNKALERVGDGTYGVCNRTGKLIREERLLAMPTARFDIKSK